ncbi:MAG TPA: aminoglycoside phosphotransferase family protein [Gemmatimonadaceae bacterium]|nr:aminoglycoside phosphotransferase family protein [Gemmatimonadaceae bacterium]
MTSPSLPDRLAALSRQWRVTVVRAFDTPSSCIVVGWRGGEPVLLKIVKRGGDEWRAGEVTRAFGGQGMVRVLDAAPGAVLLERLEPATPLVEIVRHGDDDRATAILCDVIAAMSPDPASREWPTVRDWSRGFDRYVVGRDQQLPRELVAFGQHTYLDLCESQRHVRLLHGDLQHYNVLYDRSRGWIAIDPKGVVGELEYELGAALRNPVERPDLVATPANVERRVAVFASRLSLDAERVMRWAFAQAILSAIWSVEDGERVGPESPALGLAATLRTMLGNTTLRKGSES